MPKAMQMETSKPVSKNVVLFITATSSFLTPLMGSAVNLALPALGKEFGMDAVTLAWVSTAYLLSAAAFLVPFGRIADIFGRKKVFLFGIATLTITSLFCGFAPSSGFLILFRVLQGLGGAMIFGTGVAILTSVYPKEERGKALGINTASVYLGLSAGPFLGGIITQYLGWRFVFFMNLPICLFIIAMVLWRLRGEWAGARGERVDILGSLVYALSITGFIYGLSHMPSALGGVLIGCGILGFMGFIIWELRAKSPVLDVRLFGLNRVFAMSNLAALINYAATFAVGFLVSLYLQYVKGLSPQFAGIVMISQPVVQAGFSPVSGRLSDRIEPRIVSSVGMGLSSLGLLLMAFVTRTTPLGLIILNLIVLGLGFALFSSPNTNAVMSSVEQRFYGVASGTLGTMRLVGNMLSMATVMLIFAIIIGKTQITSQTTEIFLRSMRVAFFLFSGVCAAGVVPSMVRGRVRNQPV
ncbi:MAG: MFS transporter [candidate division WOR-3 bacterium]